MPTKKKPLVKKTTVKKVPIKKVNSVSIKQVTQQVGVSSRFSLDAFLTYVQNNFVILFIMILLFMGSFFFGSLWTENKFGKGGQAGSLTVPSQAAAPTAPQGPTVEQMQSVAEITKEDHVIGDPEKAAVTLIEYSDLNCHYCQQFHPTMLAMVEKYGDKIAWVYRHHPILGSQTEAETAECVAKVGGTSAFWEFVDGYFTTVTGTPDAGDKTALATFAQKYGINQSQLQTCLDSGDMTKIVATMSAGAQKIGITSTPSTVVIAKKGGAELINGAQPQPQVEAIIEKYL